MQITRLFYGLWLGVMLMLSAQSLTLIGRPKRIVSHNRRSSVVVPRGWFVYEGGDLPAFFNFTPDKSVQGELPPGGASISMLVKEGARQRSATTLSSWAEDEIKADRGVSVEIRNINGTMIRGTSRALYVSFDQAPLGHGDPTLHFVKILWELRGNLYTVKLS